MNLETLHRVYFLGIGGIGMSAIARWFNAQECSVSGYDKTPSPLTQQLMNEGIDIHFEDNPNKIPEDTQLVVFTPAIPKNNQEFIQLSKSQIPMLKRSQILGLISEQHPTIAVAGTHGKTTVTSMIAHILKENDIMLSGFIGGIANNFASNLVLSERTDVVVVEADEFDRSFLTLHPNIAIITSMDADHLDIYGKHEELKESFILFAKQIKEGGKLIVRHGLEEMPSIKADRTSYGSEKEAYYSLSNLLYKEGYMHLDVQVDHEYKTTLQMSMPGRHNAENALAASIACLNYGLSFGQIKRALYTYKGVKRRFDIRVNTQYNVYIDDYAHHPTEIESIVKATREMFPGKTICAVFQPHLFTRTRDFANDFAESLALLDEVALMEIYPARELPIDGINSQFLLDKIQMEKKSIVAKEEIADFVKNNTADIILTLGAGDIDRHVLEIEKIISTR